MFDETLRAILREVLRRKRDSDSRYSMRRMARELGVAPSQLSLILSGRRGLSPQRAEIFGKKLGLSESERDRFRLLAAAAYSRSFPERACARRVLTRSARERVKRCRRGRCYLAILPSEGKEVIEEVRRYVETLVFAENARASDGISYEVEFVLYPADYCS